MNLSSVARRINAATLARACRAIDRALNAAPPRVAIRYNGSEVAINTRERYLRMKGKR